MSHSAFSWKARKYTSCVGSNPAAVTKNPVNRNNKHKNKEQVNMELAIAILVGIVVLGAVVYTVVGEGVRRRLPDGMFEFLSFGAFLTALANLAILVATSILVTLAWNALPAQMRHDVTIDTLHAVCLVFLSNVFVRGKWL